MKRIHLLPLAFILLSVFIFFKPFIFQGQLPIPSDTVIGLYHPFRDLYANDYPNGIPYKNFLVTDPVRQQYPWRLLSIDTIKEANLPLWNPYSMAGTPLLANVQSAVFYPLNILLFVVPFAYGWSVLIFLQQILAGVFLYIYLAHLRLNRYASILGAVTFTFSGFMIAWLEWGTIGHTALWLPLLLLSIDKIVLSSKYKVLSIKDNKILLWSLVFLFSLTSSFFAGHLQIFFYLSVLSVVYLLARWFQYGKSFNVILLFLLLAACFFLLTAVQWIPTVQFISESARSVDQGDWQKEGWFVPWQHLIQFIAPDFFGNPTTLNYWGIWNYGELVGYAGILPFIMAVFALYSRVDKKTLFYGTLFFLSLIFALPTFLAKVPYLLELPFLSTTQPTRLLFITSFSLAVLAALGFDYFMRTTQKWRIIYSVGLTAVIIAGLWFFVITGSKLSPGLLPEDIAVAKRNLYIPTFIFTVSVILLFVWIVSEKIKRLARVLNKELLIMLLIIFLLGITLFDLIRFSQKFIPFTDSAYLFPQTKSLTYLQKQEGQFRIMSTDSRILPPNFSVMYRLQSVDGYDPLYLLRYGEFISAIQRDKPDIKPPFGFNRIITPQAYNSRLIDLLGVRYVLSLTDITSPKLEKVFEEGQTKVYRNKEAFPRVFFVDNLKLASGKDEAIRLLFDQKINLKDTAVIEDGHGMRNDGFGSGKAEIVEYTENKVTIQTSNDESSFLVLMDTFYPTWHAKSCNQEETQCVNLKMYRTNYTFRGVVVPQGENRIVFYNSLL